MNFLNGNISRLFVLFFCLLYLNSTAQVNSLSLDSLNNQSSRNKTLNYGLVAGYTIGSIALFYAWYKDYPQESFHFFNDGKEWEGVDKAGHVFSSYVQTDLLHKSLKWSGVKDNKALFSSAMISLGFQSTIEIMDGFSSGWGFSVYDFGANVLGTSIYLTQELLWKKQLVKIKMSYYPYDYSTESIYSESGFFESSPKKRALALYGRGFIEPFLKDYNAQTYWLSTNPRDWTNWKGWPSFLAISFGYGANNIYGGFNNSWEINDENIIVSNKIYPRYRQFILALDYDLEKIKTDSPLFKSILKLLNIIKWPAPAIEYRSNGEWAFHLVFLN